MTNRLALAALAATLGLGHCAASGEPQHGNPSGKASAAAKVAAADALLRSDPHVAQLFNLLRALRAEGRSADMAKFQAKLADMGRAHAIEWEIEEGPSTQMINATAHKAWMAAQAHPENLASLDAFNKSIGAW